MKSIKSRTHWKNIIDEWQKEKPPIVSFCREHKLSKASFYYWRGRLIPDLNTPKKKLSTADFVPIEVCDEPHSSNNKNEMITLYYPNGCYLRVTEGCSLKLLRLVNEMMRVSLC
jgi:hypothetical protein